MVDASLRGGAVRPLFSASFCGIFRPLPRPLSLATPSPTLHKTGMPYRGDDLEDDFVADDLVALSGDEVDLDESPAEDPGSSLVNTAEGELALDKKRKRNAKQKEQRAKVPSVLSCIVSPAYAHMLCTSFRCAGGHSCTNNETSALRHGVQKRKLKQPEEDSPDSLAAGAPGDLATYLDGMQAKTYPKMSAIELADMRIPGLRPSLCLLTSDPRPYRKFNSRHNRMDRFSQSRPTTKLYHEESVCPPCLRNIH